MMKRLLTTLVVALMSFVAMAQDDNTIKFLGIPVDGTKFEMEQRLRTEKGFYYENSFYREAGILSGNFNGYRVKVSVSDYNGLVKRVAVFYPDASESQVKIQYNNLFNQLRNNEKYLYNLIESSGELSEEEDISYEMSIHDKQYQNVFVYPPYGTMNGFNKKIAEAENPEDVLADEELMAFANATLKDGKADEASVILWTLEHSEGQVWYTIGEGNDSGKYRIIMFYDNTKNTPNGEDL